MKKALTSFLVVMGALSAQAEIKTETVEYRHNGTTLEGYLAYDSNIKGKRPVIMIIHEWTGLGDYVKGRAKQFAEKGYVAFALDIYGKGGL